MLYNHTYIIYIYWKKASAKMPVERIVVPATSRLFNTFFSLSLEKKELHLIWFLSVDFYLFFWFSQSFCYNFIAIFLSYQICPSVCPAVPRFFLLYFQVMGVFRFFVTVSLHFVIFLYWTFGFFSFVFNNHRRFVYI